jgi:hypothetical protein
MAEQMGRLYCMALRIRRPLVINTDLNHTPRLLSLLQRFGGDKVPVRLSERIDLADEDSDEKTKKFVKRLTLKTR